MSQVYLPYPTQTGSLPPVQSANAVYQGSFGGATISMEIMETRIVLRYLQMDDVRRVDQYGRPIPPQIIVRQTLYPTIRFCPEGSYKLVFMTEGGVKITTSCLVFYNNTITGTYTGNTVNRNFNGSINLQRR